MNIFSEFTKKEKRKALDELSNEPKKLNNRVDPILSNNYPTHHLQDVDEAMQFDYDPSYGFHYDPTFGQSNPNIDQNLFPQSPKKLQDEIPTQSFPQPMQWFGIDDPYHNPQPGPSHIDPLIPPVQFADNPYHNPQPGPSHVNLLSLPAQFPSQPSSTI